MENRLNRMDKGGGSWSRDRRQEIREAGEDAHVGLDAHRLQASLEGGQPAALDDLSLKHGWTVSGVGSVHVTLDVRVPDDRHAADD